MTEQRIRRIKTKIQESRARLMISNPLFALLLMYVRFIAVPGMKKISTNGECIFFSPDFLDKLYDYELDYILCHQIMHIICGNIWRPDDYIGDDYHYACDIMINNILQKQGFDLQFPHLGKTTVSPCGVNIDIAGMTPEEIYGLLPYSLYVLDDRTRGRYLPDSDVFWSQTEPVKNSVLVLDIPEDKNLLRFSVSFEESVSEPGNDVGNGEVKSGNSREELEQLWKNRAASVARMTVEYSRSGREDTSDFVKRMIDKLQKPKADWKKILDDFIQETTCDYSFSPPDRRFEETGLFLPDFNEKEFDIQDVLFMVDTSGSINDDDLAAAYSEINGIIDQFGGKLTGRLGFFDTKVKEPVPFSNVNELLRIVPYGGGGTDFRSIFEYVRVHYNNEVPASIVIFTDGCGLFPQESETLGIPVLWLINNYNSTPPFGKVVRIIPEGTLIRSLQ